MKLGLKPSKALTDRIIYPSTTEPFSLPCPYSPHPTQPAARTNSSSSSSSMHLPTYPSAYIHTYQLAPPPKRKKSILQTPPPSNTYHTSPHLTSPHHTSPPLSYPTFAKQSPQPLKSNPYLSPFYAVLFVAVICLYWQSWFRYSIAIETCLEMRWSSQVG